MTGETDKLRVLVVGGGIAALETVLALRDLAGERVAVTLLSPNEEFVYRPLSVREPFAYARAARYPLASILGETGAEHVADKLDHVDADEQTAHTEGGASLEYDALVLALGATLYARFEHAITIDDRRMDEALHGLIQDVEGGYLKSVAFVAPGRMAWPLPLYELALMMAGRAYDMGVELAATIVTPEDEPLAVFGKEVSDGVAKLLAGKGIRTITSGYAEIPAPGEIVISPGDRRLRAGRVVALPELYGPAVRGLTVSEHGFLAVDRFCRLLDAGPVFAAGDAVDFPIKQGGVGSQQADVAAESIAALAGAEIEPHAFEPVIRGVLLTDEKPRYFAAEITGGHGFASHFSKEPIDGVSEKVATRYLAPRLEWLDRGGVAA
jgi:sulfide:quinone oxidoreductase